jgi:hypothetical protein
VAKLLEKEVLTPKIVRIIEVVDHSVATKNVRTIEILTMLERQK